MLKIRSIFQYIRSFFGYIRSILKAIHSLYNNFVQYCKFLYQQYTGLPFNPIEYLFDLYRMLIRSISNAYSIRSNAYSIPSNAYSIHLNTVWSNPHGNLTVSNCHAIWITKQFDVHLICLQYGPNEHSILSNNHSILSNDHSILSNGPFDT